MAFSNKKKASGMDSGCLPSRRDDLLTGLPPRVTQSLQRRFQEAKDQSLTAASLLLSMTSSPLAILPNSSSYCSCVKVVN